MNEYKERSGGRRVQKPESGKPARGRPDPREPKRGGITGGQKALIAVAAVLAVVLVVTLAYRAVFVKPQISAKDPESVSGAEEIDYGDGTRPRSDGERKSKDFYTILVMGRDTGGGGNTDTMMLASYDVTNQKLTVMNIPRDTMVNIPYDIKRINAVYNYAGGGEKGIRSVYQEVAQLVGFEPDYQIIVEWDAVGKLVDAIGGVYFEVPRNMNYDDPYQDLSIHIQKGYQLLSGEQAMGVIRYRHDNDMKYGYADGDLGRIKTQQAFLKTVIQQLLQVKNVSKINQFAQIFEENVETDLSVQNLFWLGKSAILGGLSMDNVTFVTMPNTPQTCWSRTYENNQSYVVPNAQELLELVNSSLSPFVEKSRLSDLDIMSVNADGSVSSTTGRVEDAKAAVAPVRPTDQTPESGETGTETNTPSNGETGTEPTSPSSGETGTEPTSPSGGETGTEPTSPSGGETGTEPTSPSGGETGTEPTSPSGGETGTEPTSPPGGETGAEPTSPSDGETGAEESDVFLPEEVTQAP